MANPGINPSDYKAVLVVLFGGIIVLAVGIELSTIGRRQGIDRERTCPNSLNYAAFMMEASRIPRRICR
jgi:hypothetical protein